MSVKSTKEVALLLGIGVSRLSQAVWTGRVAEPQKGPGNSFCWTNEDINRASKALLSRPYKPQKSPVEGKIDGD